MMEKGSRFLSSFLCEGKLAQYLLKYRILTSVIKKNSVFPFPFQEHLILSSVFSEVNNFDVLAKKYTAR